MSQAHPTSRPAPAELRARNLRLALILASVALLFFVGFVARLVIFHH
ncbi:MAG: cytochrome oxidase small assembly protein [Burkholderiales bacterium]|nr:cytochrome oxidase small assembly protein [Burkholderiales bacterium]